MITSSAFVVAAVLWLRRRRGSYDHFTACALVALLEIAAVLTVFCLNQNRTGRYLLPLLPYCALLVAWTVAQLRAALVQRAAILMFAAECALVHGHAFGVFQFPSLRPWIHQLDTRGKSRAILDGIVDRTCHGPAPHPYLVIVGIDPSRMGSDWAAPVPANYVVAKRQLLTEGPPTCHYDYAAGGFFGGTAAQAWTDMVQREARYFVTVDPRLHPVRGGAYNRALGEENFPALLRNVRESGLFEAEPPLSQDRAVWIFRRRDGAAP